MKDLSFLLSSSQGIALSKCYSFSTSSEPNWQVIARLVAFMSNIFPDEVEIQFSDGRHTFVSKPQASEYGSHYFITIFAEDGPLMNWKSLSGYVGFVVTILFHQMLSDCLVQLEEKAILATQNSTYFDTIQSNTINGDGTFESTLTSLHDAFPVLINCLGVFEEHFMRELLMSDEEYYHSWFLPVSDYLRDWLLTDDSIFSELYVVYHLSPDNKLSAIKTIDLDLLCNCEQFSEDLLIGLTEYAHAQCSSSPGVNDLLRGEDWSCQISHVLNIVTTTVMSDLSDNLDPSSSSFFAVSHFKHGCHSTLVACHIPKSLAQKCGIEPSTLPVTTRLSNESRVVNGGRTAYSISLLSSLPADLCGAWRVTIARLHNALHLAHNDTDNLQEASYYTARDHTVQPCLSIQAVENSQQTKISGSRQNSYGDGEFSRLSIDTVEYFPQPPPAKGDPSSWNVTRTNWQLMADKTVSRPGRTYV